MRAARTSDPEFQSTVELPGGLLNGTNYDYTSNVKKLIASFDRCFSRDIIPKAVVDSAAFIHDLAGVGSFLKASSITRKDEWLTFSDYDDDFDTDFSVCERLDPLRSSLLDNSLREFWETSSASVSTVTGLLQLDKNAIISSDISVLPGTTAGCQSQPPQSPRSPNTAGLTRSRDTDTDDEENGTSRRRCEKQKVEVTTSLLACPFSKWKPLSYSCCNGKILKNISRVQMHLRRQHRQPDYCPVCWMTFTEKHTFHLHVAARACSPQPRIAIDGLTEIQFKSLKKKADGRLPPSDQWYSLFSLLFPDSPRPASPYIEETLSMEILSFQSFMAANGLQIVEQTVREQMPNNLVPEIEEMVKFSHFLFQQAIPRILRRYESIRSGDDGVESGNGTVSNTSGHANSTINATITSEPNITGAEHLIEGNDQPDAVSGYATTELSAPQALYGQHITVNTQNANLPYSSSNIDTGFDNWDGASQFFGFDFDFDLDPSIRA
ncbi:hypothetical protein GGR57DRAFT_476274 [Xylariaceae sp. FL1272]|nr:hypothetical protein GGR57DRAFT_476274 [Xylariaceae sp. FL1272]